MRLATGVALLAAACNAPARGTESEREVRLRLQAAHDATLRLELHGRLDANAVARGVRDVQAWCDEDGAVAVGSIDTGGSVSISLPAIEAHSRGAMPILHVVDSAGAHWYCRIDLTTAPPTGRHELGDLQLQREPEAPLVVDDGGQPLVGARVRLHHAYPEDHRGFSGPRSFETVTDNHGRAPLCRAAPFDSTTRLIVRHEAFAPWSGPLAPQVTLDHGGEICGRVELPAGADPADYAVGVLVREASPSYQVWEAVYANVTAPIEPEGTYRLCNVPHGTRSVIAQDRTDLVYRSEPVEVQVGSVPTTAPDLTIRPGQRPGVAMRFRLTGHDGRVVVAPYASIHVSDVAFRVPLRDGYVDHVEEPNKAFAIAVPGYGITERTTRRSGTSFRLPGGYRVALRLDLTTARLLPPACALLATVTPLTDDAHYFAREPALYLDRDLDEDNATPLGIARDAPIVVDSPCRYEVELEMIRWDTAAGEFVRIPIDVEPREFDVLAEAQSTLVTVSSNFAETPR